MDLWLPDSSNYLFLRSISFVCLKPLSRMVFLIGLLILPAVLGLTFENNGYKDVVVAIHPDIKEDLAIVDKIKVPKILH